MIKPTLAELQTIYSERDPYVIEQRLGDAELVVFDSVFISLVLLAFSTDCVSQMSEDELDLFYNYIEYENGNYTDTYVMALSVWLANIMNNIQNPKIKECG